MEYVYRNSPKGMETTIHLQTYDMEVSSESIGHVIPYADVVEIRLNRSKKIYSIELRTLNFGTIRITSQSFGPTGKLVDQSRVYLTFTRVLHMHLLEKSKAHYFTGSNLSKLIFRTSFWAIVVSLFFVIEEYFNFLPGNPLLTSLLIFLTGTLLLFGSRLNRWPTPYNPTNIPLHMLPSAN